MWLQRVSQHSNAQQQLELSSDTLPPRLFDNLTHPSRSYDPKLSAFFSAHRSAYGLNDLAPTAVFPSLHPHCLPRILPLLAAALKHNCCDAAEAFQGLLAVCTYSFPFFLPMFHFIATCMIYWSHLCI
jgi:hypothetical protein